jgi:hypothetical protein
MYAGGRELTDSGVGEMHRIACETERKDIPRLEIRLAHVFFRAFKFFESYSMG